jgi:hypothetical protein
VEGRHKGKDSEEVAYDAVDEVAYGDKDSIPIAVVDADAWEGSDEDRDSDGTAEAGMAAEEICAAVLGTDVDSRADVAAAGKVCCYYCSSL